MKHLACVVIFLNCAITATFTIRQMIKVNDVHCKRFLVHSQILLLTLTITTKLDLIFALTFLNKII